MIKRCLSKYWFVGVLLGMCLTVAFSLVANKVGIINPITADIAFALDARQAHAGELVDPANLSRGARMEIPTLDISLLRYCVAWALGDEQIKGGQTTVEPATCFASQGEAADFIAGVTKTDEARIYLAMNGEMVMNTPIIGIDYDATNYGGAFLYWTVNNPSGCFNNNSYYAPNYPSNWDNRARSAVGGSGCGHFEHYDFTQYGGAMIDCGGGCTIMGAMGGNTSSARWRP